MPDGLATGVVVTLDAAPATSAGQSVRLPLHKPRATYVFLALIGLVFVLETVLILQVSGSLDLAVMNSSADPRLRMLSTQVLFFLGAQVNGQVWANGEYWRLLAAAFLHIGLMHLAFNGWALYILGRDVEAFLGTPRFVIIYLFAGLFGNVAYYLLGDNVLSAGASGAIFGLIGAEAAFFLRNRKLLGSPGRQRLTNLAILIVINLVFGFAGTGINNLAHLGGLFAGVALALALTPKYEVTWQWDGNTPVPRLVNSTPVWIQVGAVFLAVVLLLGGVRLGDQRWAGEVPALRQPGVALMQEVPYVSYHLASFGGPPAGDRGGLVSGE